MAIQNYKKYKRSKLKKWMPLLTFSLQIILTIFGIYLVWTYASWEVMLGVFLLMWANNIMITTNNKLRNQ